jgi:DNA replication protein DnaC
VIISSELIVEDLLTFNEAVGSRSYEMYKDYIVEVESGRKGNWRLR